MRTVGEDVTPNVIVRELSLSVDDRLQLRRPQNCNCVSRLSISSSLMLTAVKSFDILELSGVGAACLIARDRLEPYKKEDG